MDKAESKMVSRGFECTVCKDRFSFPAQLNFHMKRHSNETSHNTNTSLRCVKFGKLPGLPDVTTNPFRISRAFLKLKDPKLFRKLEKKKNAPCQSNLVLTSPTEVERTINISTTRGFIELSPVSTHVPISQSHPPVPAFNDIAEVKPQGSSSCQILNVNSDDSIMVIDITDDDDVNGSEDSQPVQNMRNLGETRVDDVEQSSFNCPLATSTPKPMTASSSSDGVERKRIKLSSLLLLPKKREKKTTVPNPVSTTALQSKTPSSSKCPPRSSANVLKSYIKKCPECNQNRFKDYYHYQNHLKVHKGLRPFLCTTCNFGYKTDLELLEHASITHLKEPAFNCPTCSSKFKKKIELDNHQCTK
ncbi:unnamed protein product [Orchesella dallaii]|uniref:C2H2-type domain-containing protein n=1 Tax=Orchesella dallaii TaxID=48710 RepID=A0ABP1Q663_9HEXA